MENEEKNFGGGYAELDEDNKYRKKGQLDMIGYLLRLNAYAKYQERIKSWPSVKAGEIYEIDFGVNVNAEFSYRHYAVILVDSNEKNPLAMVCPLKSKDKYAHPSSDIDLGRIESLDSDHDSIAVINQIRPIDKMRIFRRPVIAKEKEHKNQLHDSIDGYEEEKKIEDRIVYRLEPLKFKKVQCAALNYIEFGVINKE